jgi:hypothetical protein
MLCSQRRLPIPYRPRALLELLKQCLRGFSLNVECREVLFDVEVWWLPLLLVLLVAVLTF